MWKYVESFSQRIHTYMDSIAHKYSNSSTFQHTTLATLLFVCLSNSTENDYVEIRYRFKLNISSYFYFYLCTFAFFKSRMSSIINWATIIIIELHLISTALITHSHTMSRDDEIPLFGSSQYKQWISYRLHSEFSAPQNSNLLSVAQFANHTNSKTNRLSLETWKWISFIFLLGKFYTFQANTRMRSEKNVASA